MPKTEYLPNHFTHRSQLSQFHDNCQGMATSGPMPYITMKGQRDRPMASLWLHLVPTPLSLTQPTAQLHVEGQKVGSRSSHQILIYRLFYQNRSACRKWRLPNHKDEVKTKTTKTPLRSLEGSISGCQLFRRPHNNVFINEGWDSSWGRRRTSYN